MPGKQPARSMQQAIPPDYTAFYQEKESQEGLLLNLCFMFCVIQIYISNTVLRHPVPLDIPTLATECQ
jgi:hypothetical protein